MIDTLLYAKKLENAGFTKEQAEALIMLSSELSFHHLATKEDLKALQVATREDIKAFQIATKEDIRAFQLETKEDFKTLQEEFKTLKSTTKLDFQTLENRLTLRLGVLMGTMFTVFFAALTFVIQLK